MFFGQYAIEQTVFFVQSEILEYQCEVLENYGNVSRGLVFHVLLEQSYGLVGSENRFGDSDGSRQVSSRKKEMAFIC